MTCKDFKHYISALFVAFTDVYIMCHLEKSHSFCQNHPIASKIQMPKPQTKKNYSNVHFLSSKQ